MEGTAGNAVMTLLYVLLLKIYTLQTNVPFLYPLKRSENLIFLRLQGGIERETWPEMGQCQRNLRESISLKISEWHFY